MRCINDYTVIEAVKGYITLKENIQNSDGELKKAIYLAFFGIRRGEICALEYSDIEENLVHIPRDIIRGRNGWIVKDIPETSESERYVLLPDDYKDIIGKVTGKSFPFLPAQ